MEFYDVLNLEAENLGLEFTRDKYDKFMRYKELIKYYNKMINITAITEDEEIVKKHFIDSLEIFKFDFIKKANNIIDIGTGGGFPGIPMKIINENMNVMLLDSLQKRVKFLNTVIDELDLKNIKTIHGRAEDFSKKAEYREKYDAAVSRAVARIKVLSEYCLPFVKVGGYFVALKGPSIDDEMKDGIDIIKNLGGEVQQIKKISIMDTELNHNLVIIKKVRNTPAKYPRKISLIKK